MDKGKDVRVFVIYIVLVVIFFISISCEKKKGEDKNIIIRDNPRAYTKWNDVFGEHRIIKFKGLKEDDELIDVRGFGINSKGEYFLIDVRLSKVYYFDENGKFKKFIGRKGEGPGEAIMPSLPIFDNEDNLYLYDLLKKKIIVFASPDYNFKREFKIGETFYDYLITPDNRIIATTPYATDNFVIHKYDMEGEMIGAAFLLGDLSFSKFIVSFGLYGINKLNSNYFLYIFPNKYRIYKYDNNLRIQQTYTAEKETKYFPFRRHFPYGESPYELTKKNRRWWESKYVAVRAIALNKSYFLTEVLKFKKYNVEDSFINIHSFDGRTIGKGIRFPFSGKLLYAENGYVYFMESDRIDKKTGDLIPQVLHKYKFTF